jgi:formate hydrogenlyase transcriptional activator
VANHRLFNEDRALNLLLRGTMGETGNGFLRALVKCAAEAFGVDGAWVTEYLPDRGHLRALAFWHRGRYIEGFHHDIAGTPCETVVAAGRTALFPDNLQEAFPSDPDLVRLEAVSYIGVPMLDPQDAVIGHLAVIDSCPLPEDSRMIALFELFAMRASAEVQRMRSEQKLARVSEEADLLRDAIHELPPPGDILGDSLPMQRLKDAIARVAPTDASVLVLGETGTGKELVARAIHRSSGRAGKPLVRVNCAAIPANLIESEFFGHERGAFTGAVARREGRFALADTGTIFLDEIGEMSPDIQAKLLRVLQEGEFEPVGATRTRRVDVRVIAATNRDLGELAKNGEFREDLYYRLNVFPLQAPPLRERGEDIVTLAEVFAARFAGKLRQRFQPFTDGDRQLLLAYGWPGNVRELQNVIERAMILGAQGRPDLRRAMPDGTPFALAMPSPGGNGTAHDAPVITDGEMRAIERANIERALRVAGGRIAGRSGAAAMLGLPPSTLSSRMKSLGVAKPRH